MSRITLLTDFGTTDGYAAAMKGVLATLAPGVVLDDASHQVPRGDPVAAALALERYWRLYPPGSVHLVVVDPGVGTARRALALSADDRFVVAPDNGIVTRVLEEAAVWAAVVPEDVGIPGAAPSTTFHGRDVFAPAAARLATGTPLNRLGRPLDDPVLLAIPEPVRDGAGLEGRVLAVDRFGNLVTNIPGSAVPEGMPVWIAGREVTLRASYGHGEPGEVLAVVNSDGRLEVARRDGSAAEALGVGAGERVRAGP